MNLCRELFVSGLGFIDFEWFRFASLAVVSDSVLFYSVFLNWSRQNGLGSSDSADRPGFVFFGTAGAAFLALSLKRWMRLVQGAVYIVAMPLVLTLFTFTYVCSQFGNCL